MTELEARDFVTRHGSVWEAAISDDFQTVWHGDGTLNHPMLDRALKGRDIPALHRMQKAAAPTLVRSLAGWTWRKDIIVVEWRCTTETAGGPFAFRGMDKFRLRDGEIIEETVFSDTAQLPAARCGEALESMMRFLASDGTLDQEG